MPAWRWPSTLQKKVYLPGFRFSASEAVLWEMVSLQPIWSPLGLSRQTSWVTADGLSKSIVTCPALPLSCVVSKAIASGSAASFRVVALPAGAARWRSCRGPARRGLGRGGLGLLGLSLVLLVAGVQDGERGRGGDQGREVHDQSGKRAAARGEVLDAKAEGRQAERREHQRDPKDVEEGLVHAAWNPIVDPWGAQLAYEVDRLSRITVILIWPGYSISFSIARRDLV